jgi:hypothetical protein
MTFRRGLFCAAIVALTARLNAKVVAVTHVRVIDGTGGDAALDQTVVFSNGKIAAYGPAASTAVPRDVPTGATKIGRGPGERAAIASRSQGRYCS